MSIPYHVDEINRLIKNRRTITPEQFDPEQKVNDAIIQQMLENANWAPTHGLTEPWRFTVFTGDGLKKLAAFQSSLYKQLTPPEEFKQAKFDKLFARPLKASHVIAICMKRQEKEKIAEIEEIEAVACAVQNMQLTASAYGVGAFWSSGGITYKDAAKPFFGLLEKDRLLGFLYIGYPRKEWPEGKRSDVGEKVVWVSS